MEIAALQEEKSLLIHTVVLHHTEVGFSGKDPTKVDNLQLMQQDILQKMLLLLK